MHWDDAFHILEPLTDWPFIRYEKCRSLFSLAGTIKRGPVVELGAARGIGTIAIALGVADGIAVCTIDDFVDKVGWQGETYTADDRFKLYDNIKAAHVEQKICVHVGDVREIALHWQEPIEWLHWDIYGDRLYGDFLAWERFIMSGGMFSAKVGELDFFGYNHILEHEGWHAYAIYSGGCVMGARRD